jgi:recombination protein RecA
MSQLFRRLVQKMASSNVTLGIVSQIRDRIGVTFGRKYSRSGGHALDFYASQVLYLAHLGTESKSIKKVKRPVAVKIRAKCDKNKVGLPYRESQFNIVFGYGIDDYRACLEWLVEVGAISELGHGKSNVKELAEKLMALPQGEAMADIRKAQELTRKKWYEIETRFMPRRKKYA